MDTTEFLQAVITTEEGWFCLATRNGEWGERWYQWPKQTEEIASYATGVANQADVYFSSYLFAEASSKKQFVLPSKTIQQDLDNADVTKLPLDSSVLVKTSAGRHQGYWLLRDSAPTLEDHELLSKRLAYSIPECDHSGWPLGRKVRLPGTINHKYLEAPQEVTIVEASLTRYTLDDLDLLPLLNPAMVSHFEQEWTPQPIELGPHKLLETVKDAIPAKVYAEYAVGMPDRSKALWALMLALFRAGMNKHQVFYLAWHSANNKFARQRYHGDRDLMADVIRAEVEANKALVDARAKIVTVRGSKAPSYEKKKAILDTVVASMKREGRFLVTPEGYHYYMHNEQGRPLPVTKMGSLVGHLLDIRYGLNATEAEHNYVKEGLESYVHTLQENAMKASASYYDPHTNTAYIHSGKRYVYKVTPSKIERINDGDDGIVFDWNFLSEQFAIDPKLLEAQAAGTPYDDLGELDWAYELFGDMDNVINMSPDEARTLLKVWLLFSLFRNIASSRPLVALFGQPGAGKSTTARRMYSLLYGKNTDIGAVSSQDAFDHAVATTPIVVLDNVDTYNKWLPDKLAQSLGNTDLVKRKLFSDTDTVVIRRRAMLIVTAHNPSFIREDVVDRLLIISFERLKSFAAEAPIYERIAAQRNKLWAAILLDVQRILSTPIPAYSDLQLRVEDFARIGEWIARALGCYDTFASAVQMVRVEQTQTNQETDSPLISVMDKWLSRREKDAKPPEFKTSEQLWKELDVLSDDPQFKKKYPNGATLGRKLWTLMETLSAMFHIEWKMANTGGKEWKIERA